MQESPAELQAGITTGWQAGIVSTSRQESLPKNVRKIERLVHKMQELHKRQSFKRIFHPLTQTIDSPPEAIAQSRIKIANFLHKIEKFQYFLYGSCNELNNILKTEKIHLLLSPIKEIVL